MHAYNASCYAAAMRTLLAMLSGLLWMAWCQAQDPAPPHLAGLLPGTRLLAGGGDLPTSVLDRFVALAGGAKARIVVVPTASESADTAEGRDQTLQRWQRRYPECHWQILHTRDRSEADSEAFCAPLRDATAVWFGGGAQQRLAQAYVGTRFETELQAVLRRGGVVAGTSAGTAIQTRTMIQEGMANPIVATGFDLVPFAISDQHFLRRQRLPRLRKVLTAQPGHFGIGVDEGTAVEVSGRQLTVIGVSRAVLVLAATATQPERVVELGEGDRTDLWAWQRAARQRAAPQPPSARTAVPELQHGSLLLHGGGEFAATVVDRFRKLAGGDAAQIVCLLPPPTRGADGDAVYSALQQTGAKVTALRIDQAAAWTTAQLASLAAASAVWLGAAEPWQLCDACDRAPIANALAMVLQRGGVLGGTSGGARMLGAFLLRSDPIDPKAPWCEGYTQGLACLPGTAIDHAPSADPEFQDLQLLLQQQPTVFGLGLHAGSAALIQGRTLEVLAGGTGLTVLATHAAEHGNPAVRATPLAPGSRWDLVTRKRH